VRIEQLPEGPGLRERLLALGIYPGVRLELVRRGRPGGLLHLAHGIQEFMLRSTRRPASACPWPGLERSATAPLSCFGLIAAPIAGGVSA
jgi:Fe2+ transport system protein FeoA